MAEFPFSPSAQTRGQAQAVIDQGLRSYMLGVYNYMALGVAVTAVITMMIASNPGAMQLAYSMRWVSLIALLGLGWFAPRLIFSGSAATAHIAYWAYVGLWGVAIAPMVGAYLNINPGIVFQAFLITSLMFAATSLYGYVSKRDLSVFGQFFFMATIGILIAGLLNVFVFKSGSFSMGISVFTVLLFAGITAWETQTIKEMYVADDMASVQRSKSIFGAFALYGSFITLFVNTLNILGGSSRN